MTTPLPPSCSVEALAEWLRHMWEDLDWNDLDMARAVRALLEAKVREAVEYAECCSVTDLDAAISHTLGAK